MSDLSPEYNAAGSNAAGRLWRLASYVPILLAGGVALILTGCPAFLACPAEPLNSGDIWTFDEQGREGTFRIFGLNGATFTVLDDVGNIIEPGVDFYTNAGGPVSSVRIRVEQPGQISTSFFPDNENLTFVPCTIQVLGNSNGNINLNGNLNLNLNLNQNINSINGNDNISGFTMNCTSPVVAGFLQTIVVSGGAPEQWTLSSATVSTPVTRADGTLIGTLQAPGSINILAFQVNGGNSIAVQPSTAGTLQVTTFGVGPAPGVTLNCSIQVTASAP